MNCLHILICKTFHYLVQYDTRYFILSRYLNKNTLGFEFAMKKAWGDKMKLVDNVMFDTLPWACRMSDIGKTVRIHGTKDTMYGGVSDKSKAKPHVLEAISVVQKSLGKFPELIVNRPTLGVLLSITGVQIHPGIFNVFFFDQSHLSIYWSAL